MNNEHDPLEERLRSALAASADEVTPVGDGLAKIRERVEQKQRTSFWAKLRTRCLANPAFAAASSVGVIALGLATAIGVGQVSAGQAPFGIGGDKSTPSTSSVAPPNSQTSDTSSGSHTDKTKKTDKPDKTKTKKPATTVAVPVYQVVRSGSGGYSVSQSSRQVKISGSKHKRQEDRAEGGLKSILDGGSGLTAAGGGVWQPGTTVNDVDLVGSTLQVKFSGTPGGTNKSAEAARAALKQVVFTALEATPTATSVQIMGGGAPVSSFWGVLAINTGGVQRGDPAITRPFNAIDAPSAGSRNLSPVTIKGNGAYDGGQVGWAISEAGQEVKSGTANTGSSGFASWSHQVDLDPGDYQLTTYEQSGGGRQHVRTVDFSVFE